MSPEAVFALPADGEVLHRLVRQDRPTVESFKSRAVRGRGRLPEGPAILHAGLSMTDTTDQALARGGRYPSNVYQVRLDSDSAIHVAKTFGPGHYTVWGDPEVLLGLAAPVTTP